jgi:DNA polymerase III epsilon subunit-like protein
MIALDVETTGTNPNVHSILAIGALDFDNPTNQFYGECRAFDGAHVEGEALEINGFTEEETRDPRKKSEAELVRAFIAWAEDCRGWNIVGQNPSFDLGFTQAACARAHADFPFPHRTIDTHSLAYMHMVSRGLTPPFNSEHHRSDMNLDYILRYCGIPEEPRPHNALTGALCHAEVASRLLYDHALLPDFSHYTIPWQEHTVE